MPVSVENLAHITGNFLITKQLLYNVDSEFHSLQQHLEYIQAVPEQYDAYKHILHTILSGSGGAFFISGPTGTGKTFVYCMLCHHL